jgi:hypothetical protein
MRGKDEGRKRRGWQKEDAAGEKVPKEEKKTRKKISEKKNETRGCTVKNAGLLGRKEAACGEEEELVAGEEGGGRLWRRGRSGGWGGGRL